MEFPKLGKHCFAKDCRQLDFLPMKCDACENILCRDHITYDSHSCEGMYKKDKVVPSCPLCGKIIPVLHGQDVDTVVNKHIDTDCQSDPAKDRRNIIYVNSCSKPGCKKREAVPFSCTTCHKNYCLKHRLEIDHDCKTSAAAKKASSKNILPRNAANGINPSGMTEDEALARALQMSMETADSSSQPPAATRSSNRSSGQSSNSSRPNNRRSEDICNLS